MDVAFENLIIQVWTSKSMWKAYLFSISFLIVSSLNEQGVSITNFIDICVSFEMCKLAQWRYALTTKSHKFEVSFYASAIVIFFTKNLTRCGSWSWFSIFCHMRVVWTCNHIVQCNYNMLISQWNLQWTTNVLQVHV
jgi:hypothetical protein